MQVCRKDCVDGCDRWGKGAAGRAPEAYSGTTQFTKW
jgi:hypothetical protein